MDEYQVATDIAEGTSLAPSEAMIAQGVPASPTERRERQAEQLGQLFSISVSGTLSDTMEEVGTHNVRSLNLVFKLDASFKSDLQKTLCLWGGKLLSPDSSSLHLSFRGSTPA